MRRFRLNRIEDVHGISGTGEVAEGVIFSNGKIAMSWISPFLSVTIFENMEVLKKIHSHAGKTEIVFIDEEELTDIEDTKKEKPKDEDKPRRTKK